MADIDKNSLTSLMPGAPKELLKRILESDENTDSLNSDTYTKTEVDDLIAAGAVANTALITADADTVGAWRFNGSASDESSNELDLTLNGTDNYRPGPVGGLAHLFSAGDFARASNDEALTLTGAMSLSCVVKFSAWPDNVFVHFGANSEAESGNTIYSLRTNNSGVISYQHETGSGTDITQALFTMVTDEWAQITVTRDSAGTGLTAYLNGYTVGNWSLEFAATGGTASALTVGASQGATRATGLTLCALQIWDKELSAAEVLAHTRATYRA